jgi:hypothetical protein
MLRVVFLRQESLKRHTSVSVSQPSVVTVSLTLIQIRVYCTVMHKGSLSSNFSGLPNILAKGFACNKVVGLCASFQKQQYTRTRNIRKYRTCICSIFICYKHTHTHTYHTTWCDIREACVGLLTYASNPSTSSN